MLDQEVKIYITILNLLPCHVNTIILLRLRGLKTHTFYFWLDEEMSHTPLCALLAV
jgi:hypothetical protein